MDHSNQCIEKFYGDMKILRMDLDKQLPKETVFFRLLLHDRVNTRDVLLHRKAFFSS
jgi:hypothetical protein